jgi:hypothetical protein
MMTKTWVRPELVVLSRGTAAEALYTICKGGGHAAIVARVTRYNGCVLGPPTDVVDCSMCQWASGS